MGDTLREGDTFGRILYYWGWWDCPRQGVCEVGGVRTHFLNEFSDDLDDYPAEFTIWPATLEEFDAGNALWQEWAAWRRRFDLGDRGEAFMASAPARQATGFVPPRPPSNAQLALPEWRLDPNRSFAHALPAHWVRWHSST